MPLNIPTKQRKLLMVNMAGEIAKSLARRGFNEDEVAVIGSMIMGFGLSKVDADERVRTLQTVARQIEQTCGNRVVVFRNESLT